MTQEINPTKDLQEAAKATTPATPDQQLSPTELTDAQKKGLTAKQYSYAYDMKGMG